MSQATDYVLSNQSGAAFRAELNTILAAIVSANSGASEPTTMYAFMPWADTSAGLLKIRNAANDNWVTVGTLADVGLGLLSRAGGVMTGLLNTAKGADVASATTLPLINDGNYFDVTGATTITAFASLGVGTWIGLHFDGILTLTHNATDLILPTGANITTAAGDEAIFVEYATGDWRCVSYTRASGEALVGSTTFASEAEYITGTETAKALSPAVARDANIVLGTAQTTNGSASYNFTGIPAWVKKITLNFSGISTNGSSNVQIQIGDSAGIETTGYASSGIGFSASQGFATAFTSGFVLSSASNWLNTIVGSGSVTISLLDGNTWVAEGLLGSSAGTITAVGTAGVKTLSDTLTQVRLTTINGTDAFDAGSINISYE